MQISCTNCNSPNLDVEDVPVRGPTNDDVWLCLWCNVAVCVDCWHKHTQEKHPNAGKKKKKK